MSASLERSERRAFLQLLDIFFTLWQYSLPTRPGGEIGRRTSFRCWRLHGREGSSPFLGTKKAPLNICSAELFICRVTDLFSPFFLGCERPYYGLLKNFTSRPRGSLCYILPRHTATTVLIVTNTVLSSTRFCIQNLFAAKSHSLGSTENKQFSKEKAKNYAVVYPCVTARVNRTGSSSQHFTVILLPVFDPQQWGCTVQ